MLGRDVAWFLGLYLAEGSRSGTTIQISGSASEFEERLSSIRHLVSAYDGSVTHTVTGNSGEIRVYSRILNAAIDHYLSGRIAADKHLKNACWQRDNEWIRALLDGYLAGDGSYEEKNDRWRIGFTRNYMLQRDLRTMAARLGAQIRLNPSEGHGFGKRWKTFRGEIRFNPSNHHNRKGQGEVTVIKHRRDQALKFWDIEVEDEPNLFSLASGLLTHNSKPNAMPSSVKDRPTTAHEYVFLLSKSAHYHYDHEAVREPAKWERWGDQTANKYRGTDSTTGWIGAKSKEELQQRTTRNMRSVWSIPTSSSKEEHLATFPEDLVKKCILAGCPQGGTVLDPFMGSGTTALVARALGRKSIGIDVSERYCARIAERMAQQSLI